jgi:hypothetical protein
LSSSWFTGVTSASPRERIENFAPIDLRESVEEQARAFEQREQPVDFLRLMDVHELRAGAEAK